MKTILYNKDTQEVKHHAKEGYYHITTTKKGRHRPDIPEPWVELEFLNLAQPVPTETQKTIVGPALADLEFKKYYPRTYQVVDKTAFEIASEEFGYMEYQRRFDVHGSVLFDPTGVAYRSFLEDKGYPVEIQDDDSYKIWLDEINPAHQGFIDTLKANNLLVETLRPEENE